MAGEEYNEQEIREAKDKAGNPKDLRKRKKCRLASIAWGAASVLFATGLATIAYQAITGDPNGLLYETITLEKGIGNINHEDVFVNGIIFGAMGYAGCGALAKQYWNKAKRYFNRFQGIPPGWFADGLYGDIFSNDYDLPSLVKFKNSYS